MNAGAAVVLAYMDKVIVVGAGPAGLATAAQLRRAHVPAIVLEQADAIASAWRGRYDRLKLNSPRWYSRLPDGPAFKAATFPSRDELVAYLDEYARRHALDVRLGVRVERIEREDDRWRLVTSAGEMQARDVVVAGGYEHRPVRARVGGPRALPRRGPARRGLPLAGAVRRPDVLVVGPGCSGAEIAFDLAEGGAARVRLAVRTPPNIIVRDPVGAPLATFFHKLPPRIGDAVMRFVRRKTVGDLSEYGLPVPEEGVFSRLKRLHVAPMIVDAEVLQAIRERRIEIVGAVEGFDETGVLLAGEDADRAGRGDRRHGLPHRAWSRCVGHLGVLDAHGVPRVLRGEAAPGLRFVGYDPRPAQLRYLGIEASRAAKAIARAVKPVPPTRLEAARAVR